MGYEYRDSLDCYGYSMAGHAGDKGVKVDKVAQHSILMDWTTGWSMGTLGFHKSGDNTKYNVLFGDGHVVPVDDRDSTLIAQGFQDGWGPIPPPGPSPTHTGIDD